MRKLKTILLAWTLMFTTGIIAQNSTCSPYSQYGLGELSDHTPNAYRAMGGVGIGMRSNRAINPAQPASYTACDSLTFMFDIAAGVSWSRYKDATGQRNRANGNLEYIALQFPIWKQHIAFAAGFLPYASKGYEIVKSDSITGQYHFNKIYGGYGTISEVFAGLSFNLFDWVAVGGNFYYMFGNMFNQRDLAFYEGLQGVTEEEYLKVSNCWWKVGLQAFHTFGDHGFVVGGTFQYKMPLHSQYYVFESQSEWYGDSIVYNNFDIPTSVGVGASYTWKKRLTVAVDYNYQKWSECRFTNLYTKYYRDRHYMHIGAEYCHNPLGRDYVDRMCWRLGAKCGNSYLNQVRGPEFTISAGIGFPLRNVGTLVNTTIEYSRRGQSGGLIEDNLKFTVNTAVAENWFFKRRL